MAPRTECGCQPVAATIASIDSGFARKYEYEEEEADDDMTVGYWRVVERD